eukprot:877608-Prorocentrum_minimum.AAC.2
MHSSLCVAPLLLLWCLFTDVFRQQRGRRDPPLATLPEGTPAVQRNRAASVIYMQGGCDEVDRGSAWT